MACFGILAHYLTGSHLPNVMLTCNCIVLHYALVMYNKSISEIDIVQSIA